MTDMNSFEGTFFEGGEVAHSINVGYNENGVFSVDVSKLDRLRKFMREDPLTVSLINRKDCLPIPSDMKSNMRAYLIYTDYYAHFFNSLLMRPQQNWNAINDEALGNLKKCANGEMSLAEFYVFIDCSCFGITKSFLIKTINGFVGEDVELCFIASKFDYEGETK